MQKWNKAIVAAVGLAVALANGYGWEIPPEIGEKLIALLIWAAGTFGVFQVANKDPKASSRIQSPPVIGILAGLMAVLMLSGCAGTRASYEAADGLEETAKVVAEHYYATVRELNELDDAGALSPTVRAEAQDLVRRTAPLVRELAEAAQAWEAVRSAENEIQLQDAINDAAIAVSDLIDVFKGAGSGEAWLRSLPVDAVPVAA